MTVILANILPHPIPPSVTAFKVPPLFLGMTKLSWAAHVLWAGPSVHSGCFFSFLCKEYGHQVLKCTNPNCWHKVLFLEGISILWKSLTKVCSIYLSLLFDSSFLTRKIENFLNIVGIFTPIASSPVFCIGLHLLICQKQCAPGSFPWIFLHLIIWKLLYFNQNCFRMKVSPTLTLLIPALNRELSSNPYP